MSFRNLSSAPVVVRQSTLQCACFRTGFWLSASPRLEPYPTAL